MSARSTRLRQADRALFALVSEAAFANPFGAQRQKLDEQISDGAADDPAWTARMLRKVGERLGALAPNNRLSLSTFDTEERELIEHTILFEAFHRFVEPLDALIEQQRSEPSASLRVPFAAEFQRLLVARGLDATRAERALAMFFQMRRAFSFISRGLLGQSPCMRELREQLWHAVFTCDLRRYERHLWNRMEDFSTMLLGETGSGKGAAASALGASGFIPFDASKGAFAYSFLDAFVPIHLNEFPEALFESEIFGHRKGAFTGAIDHYEGALARCKPHGTVFFDEIGEATLPVQVKLLRVLQDRSYSPVGSREQRRFSGRIVAATHRSLDELRARGAMRDDFYYRLCSNAIAVPPLRQRIAQNAHELPALVRHMCERMTDEGADVEELAHHVLQVISDELGSAPTFPGNVRELEQSVRRVLVTGHATATSSDTRGTPSALADALQASNLTAEAVLQRYCAELFGRTGSYVEVARITGLDRRTVKKHVARSL